MKVLFINREMTMNPGGGETSELRFAEALKKLGVEVEFLIGKPLLGGLRVPFKKFPAHYAASPYLRGMYQKLPFPLNIPVGMLDLWLFAKACLRYLKRNQEYEIVHVLSVPQIAALKKYRSVPLVMRFPGPPSKWYKSDIAKFDVVFSDGDALVQTRKFFRRDALEIPIGIDGDVFKPSSSERRKTRCKLGLGDAQMVLYTGRFMPIKNVSLLIRAMRFVVDQQPNAKLVLVGEGPLEAKLRGEVKRVGLEKNVIFVGRVTSGIESYYAAADVFCMSSLYDNYPNSVLEAMSCGLPIVTTRVGGIPLQVKDGKNGFLVESGDEVALAEKILFLLNNPGKAKKMGSLNRKWVTQHFSWTQSAKKLKKVYEALLKKTKADR